MVKDKKAYDIYVYIVVDNIGYNTFINYNILCEQIFYFSINTRYKFLFVKYYLIIYTYYVYCQIIHG